MSRFPGTPRLDGIHVLVTRDKDDAGSLGTALRSLGAAVHTLPAIAIEPPEDFGELDMAIGRLAEYDWVAFSSRNAVRGLLRRMRDLGVEWTRSVSVASIGPSTSEQLRNCGLTVDVQAEHSSAAGLLLAMPLLVENKKILVPRGDRSRGELREGFEDVGAVVDEVTVYRTVRPAMVAGDAVEALRSGQIDVSIFASPSSVSNLVSMLDEDAGTLAETEIVCIGKTTAQAASDHGLRVASIAPKPSIAGLLESTVCAAGRLAR